MEVTLNRLLALAEATEEEADRLVHRAKCGQDTLDMANFRYGQAIGLRQAVEMLAAEYLPPVPASS